MFKVIRIALLLVLLLSTLRASHYKCIDAWYVCLGNGVYRIYLRVCGDCASSLTVDDPPGQGGFTESFIQNPSNCAIPLGPWVKAPSPIPNTVPPDSAIYPDVTPLCPNSPIGSRCTDPTSPVPGTREIIFYRDYNLSSCNLFEIRFSNCCRNDAIDNIQNPGSQGMGYILRINRQLASCNSSPFFTERPSPYLCRNVLASINQGAIDPDGDSLVFRFCAPIGDNFLPLPFVPPMTFNNPFPPSFGATIDPVTGTVTLTPTINNWDGVFTICVDEYRNGVLIGTIVRDMQLTVVDCNALSNVFGFGPQTPPIASGINGTNQYSTSVCLGDNINFFIKAYDPDTDKVLMTWNNAIPGASFVTSNVFVDSNVAYFSWTPTTPGTYTFVVNVRDDHCPLQGSNQFAYTIIVPTKLDTVSYSKSVQCNDVLLNVVPTGGKPPYTYQWVTTVGNNNLPNPTFTFNGPGNYPVQLTITDSLGCTFVVNDTITITPDDGVYIDAGIDLSYCSGTGPFSIGSDPKPNQTYSWSPSNGLSNPNVSNPLVNLSNSGTSPITVSYELTVTKFNCVVKDTVNVTVYPVPQASITANQTQYCIGDTVRLQGPSGMSSYIWSTGDTTQVIEFPATSSVSVSLAVSDNGACLSSFVSYLVQVYPRPIASIAGPDSVCPGKTVTLTAFGAHSYLWSTGANTPTVNVTPNTNGTTYWVIPFNSNGCPGDTIFKTIYYYNVPTPNIIPQTVANQCIEGNSFTFTATGGETYFWDFGYGAVPAISTQPTVTVTYLGPGPKEVKLVAYSKGCISDTVRRTFVVNPKPRVTFPLPNPQCFVGHSFDFDGQGIWGTNPQFYWDFGPNATPQTSNQENPKNVRFNAPGTYPVTFYVIENGCTSNVVTQNVVVHPTPEPPTVVEDTVCQGYATLLFANANDPNLLIEWFTSPTASNPFFIGNQYYTPQLNSSTTYYLGTINSDSCRSVTRTPLRIKVNPSPSIQIFVSEDTVYLPSAVAQFQSIVPNNVKSWLWTFGDGSQSTNPNPVYQYTQEGTYDVTLTVVDSNGCINSIVKKKLVHVLKDMKIWVPSAFTPNGDNINDEFYITTKYITSLQMVIMNRWNQVVFETNDLNFRWNGTDKTGKNCPEGVYTYYIKARDFDNQLLELAGTVTLIR